MIHLAYLFASPLVLETSEGTHFDVLAPISFKEEFNEIISTISEQKVRFRYKYKVANEISLKECLNDNPLGMHFSGHGFENNDALFHTDKKARLRYKNRGDALIFEKKNGASDFFFESDLKAALQNTDCTRLDFVVVASCHS